MASHVLGIALVVSFFSLHNFRNVGHSAFREGCFMYGAVNRVLMNRKALDIGVGFRNIFG